MIDSARPRRTALYVPGNNPRAIEKATSLPTDVVIFDLEDAVDDDAKTVSRAAVCEAISSGAYAPREIVIRINALGTEWHDADLAAAVHSGGHAVLVPKVENGEQVQRLAAALEQAHAPKGLKLWAMIETPGAFLRSEEIASADDRLAVLVVGTNDLINSIHGIHRPGRAPIMTPLSLAVLGAKTAGKTILDGAFNNITDQDGLMTEARQGRDMGFDGKSVIHPSQIEPVNAAFGPSAEEVGHARKVVSSYEQALAAGKSVIVVEGQMIESLHVQEGRRILALQAIINELATKTA